MTIFRRNGKQILADDQHFADAATEEGAELIVIALRLWGERSTVPQVWDCETGKWRDGDEK